MRIAFVSISRFPCAVEAQRQPVLARQPLIVGDAEEPKRVFDCSVEAAKAGVRQGMTIRQALSHSPAAMIVAPDLVLYRGKWEAILEALGNVTPEVEDEELGRAYLNITGLESHYRDDDTLARHVIETVSLASGLNASVGLAGGKLPAFAAATACLPGKSQVVPRNAEAAFLAPLEVDLLPIDPEITFRLRLFGLDHIGDVAALSMPELQSQFGFPGKRLWQLANGIDDEPLRPRDRAQALQTTMSLETSVAGIDVMIAIARQLLSRLKLPLKGRAARQLTLEAELESGRGWQHHLVFREPVSEDERLAFLLRSALTHFPPPQAIRSLTLRLTHLTVETGRQLSLGGKHRQQRQLEEAIRQLKARYGYSPIYRCVDVEPWSLIPEERQILVESDA